VRLSDLEPKFTCQVCGHRGADVRPNFQQLGWEPAINEYATDRPIADPEQAARKLMEIASTVEPVKDGRLHIEKINAAVRRVRRG
jgi:hypothetical protein